MRIAIIEQNTNIFKQIKNNITTISNNIYIERFNNALLFIEEYKRKSFDILIYNIDNKGIEEGVYIRQHTDNLNIIILSSKDYYQKSFIIQPFWYLKIPLNNEYLKNTLKGAIYSQQSRYYLFKTYEYNIPIEVCDIIYIETMYSDMYVITKDHVYSGSKRVNTPILNDLKVNSFYKLDRSHIINFDHIKIDYKTYIEMSNGDEIDVGRNKRKQFKEAFIDYCNTVLFKKK